MRPTRLLLLASLTLAAASPARAQAAGPADTEGDYTIHDFRFDSGETLPELRIHYTTLGKPRRDRAGVVRNAVLILHGTTGSGRGFLSDNYGGRLFGAGQLLDADRYYLILPDGIGHGGSSKPSDGLHARFPKYTYDDMVRAHHQLLTEHLGVNHLRLVTGTSMGGMQSWVWGYSYPTFMDALMPLASLPVEIAGRNRMMRKMIIDAITEDPAWKGGEYREQPPGLTNAIRMLLLMVSVPLQWQKDAPTRTAAEQFLADRIARYRQVLDANDVIYAFDASRLYDPSPHLSEIEAPLVAINSADDQVNPPELGILEREITKVPHGKAVVLPISEQTRGHGTHSLPAIWGSYLSELLASLPAMPD